MPTRPARQCLLSGSSPSRGGRGVHRLAASLHASFSHSVALMQLRFASFAVINLRRDLHPQECARAGRTRKMGGIPEDPAQKTQGLCQEETSKKSVSPRRLRAGDHVQTHAWTSAAAGPGWRPARAGRFNPPGNPAHLADGWHRRGGPCRHGRAGCTGRTRSGGQSRADG